jgi:hypothetical protein
MRDILTERIWEDRLAIVVLGRLLHGCCRHFKAISWSSADPYAEATLAMM